MRKLLFSAIAPLLAVILLLGVFAGCSKSNEIVLSCEGVDINEEAYHYWFIQLKQYYISSFSDIVDSKEFWESEVPGLEITYGEFIDDKIKTQINFYLAGNVFFERYDLSLNDSAVASIDEEINDGINAFGSRAKYDAYLEDRYGVDSRALRKIKLMEQKFYAVYQYLYNEKTGIETATKTEIENFYLERFARIKYFMVLKKYAYVYDDKGNRVTDTSGQFKMEALDEKGVLDQQLLANEAYQKILSGESIDSFNKKYYADLEKKYPNGYYLIENETYAALFTATVVNATFGMKIGDTVLCENDDAYFIITRLPLIDKAYEGSDSSQFSDIAKDAVEAKFIKKFNEVIETITVNEDIVDSYSVVTVK